MLTKPFASQDLSSISALRFIRLTLLIFGFIPPEQNKVPYYLMATVSHMIAFFFPVSLTIGLFQLEEKADMASNLSQLSCQIIIVFKMVNIFIKKNQFFQLCELLDRLDKRVNSEEETIFLKKTIKFGRYFLIGYFCMYCSSGTVCVLSNVFSANQALKFPAWFPWDTTESTIGYRVAFSYEIIGIFTVIYMDVIGDTYLGLLYWLLKGHLKALGMRVSRIGYDAKKSSEVNYQDLIECVKDHETCLKCYNLCQDISSQIMMLQFICTQAILGVTALYLIFINEDFWETFYLAFFFTCMVWEVSLCCYCGSELMMESSEFTKHLYSCNWMDQDTRFRRVLIIFMQHTQKSWIIWAGGIATVTLETWLKVLKATYSLFAVLSQMA